MHTWFSTREVDAFAEQLVKEVLHRIPPSTVPAQSKKHQSKHGRTRDVIFNDVSRFAQNHSLNVYTKAKLANRFKWGLLEAGYPRDFVDQLAFDLAALIAQKRPKGGA